MRINFLLLLILLFTSCKNQSESLTIERTKMVEILADIHIAEEMQTKFRTEQKDSVAVLYMREIRTIHKIDSTELQKNIVILQSNPELGVEVYAEVYSLLDEYSKEIKNKSQEEKQEKDKKAKSSALDAKSKDASKIVK